MHAYSFSKFPNREHGEWFHYLDREGRPIANFVKGLTMKDPFHLPRALIYSIARLREDAKPGG